MHRHDHKEREPKAFPQYDDAAHIDSAAGGELAPGGQYNRDTAKGIPKQRPTRRNTARSSTNNKRRNDTNRSAVWR